MECPKCKSEDVVKAGKALRKGGRVQRYQCGSCGHIFLDQQKKESD